MPENSKTTKKVIFVISLESVTQKWRMRGRQAYVCRELRKLLWVQSL